MIGELYRIELISEPNPVAEVYARLHEQRWDLVDERRRARDYQAELAECEAHIDDLWKFIDDFQPRLDFASRELMDKAAINLELSNEIKLDQQRKLSLAAENARILAIIADAQRRHSSGSQTRAVLDAIALEIAEGREE